MRRANGKAWAVCLLLALAACSRAPVKHEAPADAADYTPGGLYKPDVPDGAPESPPPDLASIPEPVPRDEPRARYGNRSPYSVLGRTFHVLPNADGYLERGTASWYGNKFHGRATSSLEPYDMYRYSAAHRTLPLPSYVQVTNLENGRSVVVRVNDRGPFHGDRLIDLSYVAALRLGMLERGTAPVEVRALRPGEGPALAERAPTPAPPAADAPVWLQVGSFRDHDNAERLRRGLQTAGVERVELQPALVASQTIWRVRVGPLLGEALLREMEHLAALGLERIDPVRD